MDEKYFPEKIEKKWQQRWAQEQTFEIDAHGAKPSFYCLEMLPYPSGFLHVGHARNYVIGDAFSWYKRLNGFNVLHALGWDSFGQPAEQAAIKRGVQPREWTEENIAYMRGQFKRLGISYDWRREVAAHTPEYYKWDQWFFLKMYERGYVYRRNSPVNWCPNEETVLSNEQSASGVCWRCGAAVTRKNLEQWFIRTTEYAAQLLDDMNEIERGWPSSVLTRQRNWIGRSVGAFIDFKLQELLLGREVKIRVFTTRIDTIYGTTALVLAIEHPLIKQIAESRILKGALRDDILQFVELAREEHQKATSTLSSTLSRQTGEEAEKKGINTGLLAVNPFSGELVPVWVGNYVLMEYGAGAVMCVPGHDERDFEFAKKYTLPIRTVIVPVTHEQEAETGGIAGPEKAFTEYGMLLNSGEWSAKLSMDAIREMTEHAARHDFGEAATTYRLRDWGISRQRFWGAPIPIIYCDACGIVPVPEKDLPVRLPESARFTGVGESPLASVKEFVDVACPKCHAAARRETDTMDTFVDSSWYFFRYCDPQNRLAPFDSEVVAHWTPVDQYIGGDEHAVMHLLYTRFWTKFMRDIGLVSFNEPIKRLLTQGMVTNIVAETGEWRAMSKSLGNGVDPDEMIRIYGADAVRLFVLFAAPPENELRWSETGIDGTVRFLRRLYTLVFRSREFVKNAPAEAPSPSEFSTEAKDLRRATHQTIIHVTNDFEKLHVNTCVSALMMLLNELSDFKINPHAATSSDLYAMREGLESITLMLAPFCPHMAEELWLQLGHTLGHTGAATLLASGAHWPTGDPALARSEQIEIPIQINGRLRSRVIASSDTTEEDLRTLVLNDEKTRRWLDGHNIVKFIVVRNRLVNIVVKAEKSVGKTDHE